MVLPIDQTKITLGTITNLCRGMTNYLNEEEDNTRIASYKTEAKNNFSRDKIKLFKLAKWLAKKEGDNMDSITEYTDKEVMAAFDILPKPKPKPEPIEE